MNIIGLKPFTAKPTHFSFEARRQSENKVTELMTDSDGGKIRGTSDLLQQKREINHLRWMFLATVVDRVLLLLHILIVVTNLTVFAYKIAG